MRAARVVIRADVTSFRHPHFVIGRQPTHDMPPPSTIYGLCAAALGEWPDRSRFFFGLHFEFESRAGDLEHEHIATALGAKTKARVPTPSGEERGTTEITVQPVVRDFLFDAHLTLYVPPELAPAFRRPVHTVVLGRSQDLAEVVAVEEVNLVRAAKVRLEHTLLPHAVRPCVRAGTTALLTRWISPPPERDAELIPYVVLHEAIFRGPGAEDRRAWLEVEGIRTDDLWCDPSSTDDEGFTRGVWIHRLVE